MKKEQIYLDNYCLWTGVVGKPAENCGSREVFLLKGREGFILCQWFMLFSINLFFVFSVSLRSDPPVVRRT